MWQVLGHSKAITLLESGLKKGNLSHAYLFAGPRHVGKMTLAINLAQALNCDDGERPCGQCQACLRISAGKHADVQVIEPIADDDGKPRTEIGIDQIREVQHAASLRPYEGKYRVFIIDGAERLTTEAANCLLKTLEEPPPNVLIILLAMTEAGLLPTVLSRCQRLELGSLPVPVVEAALVERWGVAPEKARLVARLSRGCIGWAVAAGADDKFLSQRSQKLSRLLSLASATRNERFAYAAELAAEFSSNRESAQEVLDLWLTWWQDLLLVKAGCSQFVTNVDQEEALRRQAEGYTLSQIKGFIEALGATSAQLNQNANPRLVFDVLMLSIPHHGRSS